MDDDRPPAFRAFVAKADEGRNSLPRILVGLAIVLAVWFAGTLIVMTAGAAALWAGWLPETLVPRTTGDAYVDLVGSRIGLAIAIFTLAAIWPGVWIAQRLVHRRRLSTLFGPGDRLSRGDFGRAALVTLVVAVVVSLLTLFFEPSARRSEIGFAIWIVYAVPLAFILLLQTSAEELLFRGYLMQSLAQRFRSWLIWGFAPATLFAFAHWSPGAQPWMNAAVVISILMFAVSAIVLVRATGNLGAAMGMHFANNCVALLFLSSAHGTQNLSLYVTPAINDPSWMIFDAVVTVVQQGGLMAAILLLLLWGKSPLRLTGAGA